MNSVDSVRRILFVCTGNTCRSPLAEAIAVTLAAELNASLLEFGSAGTNAYPGAYASEHAVATAASHRMDLRDHRARRLTAELSRWADLVVGMTTGHVQAVKAIAPGVSARLLTELLPVEDPLHGAPVPDPFGGDLAAYAETFDAVHHSLGTYLLQFAEGDTRGI